MVCKTYMQACLKFPLPPNFGMSKHWTQDPQFEDLQAEQSPHLRVFDFLVNRPDDKPETKQDYKNLY